jgi:hypothetical protein
VIGEFLRQQVEKKAQQHAKRESVEGIDPVDTWSALTPWAELLADADWTPTGLYDTCGPDCTIWTRPGEAGSAKSATAHEVGCLQFDTDTGWAPLHVWSDIAAEDIGRTVTKLQFVAKTQFAGDHGEAMRAMDIASLATAAHQVELDNDLLALRAAPRRSVQRETPDDSEPSPAASSSSSPSGSPGPSSRLFADLQPYIDGTDEPEAEPTILARTDGKCLFYPGKLNGLFGEPESGKTFVALAAVASVLNAGGSAAYLDIDGNGAGMLVRRMTLLGAAWQSAYEEKRLVIANGVETKEDLLLFVKGMVLTKPDIVIIDALGDALPMYGAKSESNDDVTLFLNILAQMAAVGTAVVTIDHVTKNQETRGGYAIGAQAKKARMDGSYMSVSPKDGFAPGRGGSAYINKAKDRAGLVANASTPRPEELWGTFYLSPEGGYAVLPPDPNRVEAVSHRDAAAQAAEDRRVTLSRVLEHRLTLGDDLAPVTITRLKEDGVGFATEKVRSTMEELLEGGYVKTFKAGRYDVWVSLKPYTSLEEDLAGLPV